MANDFFGHRFIKSLRETKINLYNNSKNMGGHDAHHNAPPYKIPSPDIYKVEDVPELKRVQEVLAKKGLKDPWLRNQVWRYNTSQSSYIYGLKTLTRGWKIGIPAFLITIAVEQYFGIDYSGHGHHGDNHGDGHH